MGQKLDKLSPNRRAFVVAYVTGETAGNGGASYEAVPGYSVSGDVASKNAHRLLKIAEVAQAVAELRAETIEKAEASKVLSAAERHEILASIARDADAPHSARVASMKLDAELRGELVKRHNVNQTVREVTVEQATEALESARGRLASRGLKVVQ